jgi:hypothetical protein
LQRDAKIFDLPADKQMERRGIETDKSAFMVAPVGLKNQFPAEFPAG